MFKELQKQHHIWAVKNFGKQDVDDYILGMIEEVGELAHSVLKRKQGIRNNKDHDALIADAIGDITIYLVGFCNCREIDSSVLYMRKNTINHGDKKLIDIVSLLSMSVSLLVSNEDSSRTYKQSIITILFERLFILCALEQIDFEQTVQDTWNTVSKRDWVNNPDNTEVADTDDMRYQGFPV